MQQNHPYWFQALLADVHRVLLKWNGALFRAQRNIIAKDEKNLNADYQIKVDCYVRFVHLQSDSQFELPFPNHDQIGLFREVKGTVVRISTTKLLEVKRTFICSNCRTTITVNADYCMMYQFEIPKSCTKADCKGKICQENVRPPVQHCVQYQELKIQVNNKNKQS